MARKPEIFLRDLDPDEAQRLVKIARSTREGAAAPCGHGVGVDAGPVGAGDRGDVRREAGNSAGADQGVQRSGVRGAGPKSTPWVDAEDRPGGP